MHKKANALKKLFYAMKDMSSAILSIVGTHPEDHMVTHNYYG